MKRFRVSRFVLPPYEINNSTMAFSRKRIFVKKCKEKTGQR
ncbi:hypothetical protein CPL00363_CDS0157 [Klebsiella phage Torridgeon]